MVETVLATPEDGTEDTSKIGIRFCQVDKVQSIQVVKPLQRETLTTPQVVLTVLMRMFIHAHLLIHLHY